MNILKNKPVLNLYRYSVITFRFLNKYLYLVSIFSLIISLKSYLNDSKIYRFLSWFIKFILLINLILGTGLIIYFTDFNNPLENTYSFYYDLLKPYLDYLINLYNDLLNINIEDSIISNIKETSNIKNDIKLGIKEGIKEALDETITELEETIRNNNKSDLYKNVALAGGFLFFSYFFFYLPGFTPVPVEELSLYNFINQSLIEFKIVVKDFVLYLFSNP
jgi:hypothetical protein